MLDSRVYGKSDVENSESEENSLIGLKYKLANPKNSDRTLLPGDPVEVNKSLAWRIAESFEPSADDADRVFITPWRDFKFGNVEEEILSVEFDQYEGKRR